MKKKWLVTIIGIGILSIVGLYVFLITKSKIPVPRGEVYGISEICAQLWPSLFVLVIKKQIMHIYLFTTSKC
ncbi:hypothetical protein HQN90_10550 [Paenibacillus alba]|uniref:hypothetical protein n=1 Tax=Paenibacillus alba TaxID=1197127 RepID=UPI0015640959|nr:hypothetical protein [Paenibacillus alba]NQX66565.1 hypothetical protein [Paenibacillus alba]